MKGGQKQEKTTQRAVSSFIGLFIIIVRLREDERYAFTTLAA